MASVQNNGMSTLFSAVSRIGNTTAADARGSYRERALTVENRSLSAQNRSLESTNRSLESRKQALENRNQTLERTVGRLETQVSQLENSAQSNTQYAPSSNSANNAPTVFGPGRVVDTYA